MQKLQNVQQIQNMQNIQNQVRQTKPTRPNQTKPTKSNLPNRTIRTKIDQFVHMSSTCDTWVCNVRSDCVMGKRRLRGLRIGCVIYQMVDLVEAANT